MNTDKEKTDMDDKIKKEEEIVDVMQLLDEDESNWDASRGWGEGDDDGWDGQGEDEDFSLPSERGF